MRDTKKRRIISIIKIQSNVISAERKKFDSSGLALKRGSSYRKESQVLSDESGGDSANFCAISQKSIKWNETLRPSK